MAEEKQMLARGLGDGKGCGSHQLVFLPGRDERYCINGENSNVSELFCVAMPFHLSPLNGGVRYRNTIHSKPPLAHDNSSGLGRNRMMFYRLSSAVTCCSALQSQAPELSLQREAMSKLSTVLGIRNEKCKPFSCNFRDG